MNCKKKVHIMLATYNGEKYINEQLNSLVNQTYTNWVLYIRDDGSIDGTLDKIKLFKQEQGSRVILIEHKIDKRGAKENFAYMYSIVDTADYYMFCDQDDVWVPEKIEIMVREMIKLENDNSEKTPLIVYSDMKVVDENLEVIHGSFVKCSKLRYNEKYGLKQSLLYNTIPGCAMIFNEALRYKVSLIPDEAEMHDWWLVIICAATGKISNLNYQLTLYRQHNKNVVGTKKISWISKLKNILGGDKLAASIERTAMLKECRKRQAEKVLYDYKVGLNETAILVIEEFTRLIGNRNKNKVKTMMEAYSKHYFILNRIYTIKFWLF